VTALSERLPPRSGEGQGGAIFLAICGFLLLGMRQNLTVPMTRGHSVAQTLILVAAVVWALTRLRGERAEIRSRPLMIAILLYTIASLISYASATGRGLSHLLQNNSDASIITNFELVTIVLAIMAMLRTIAEVMLVLKGMLLGGTLSAGFAIVQSLTGLDMAGAFRLPGLKEGHSLVHEPLIREEIVRPQGSAAHPLALAVVLTILIPIGIGIVSSARARREKVWPWIICTIVILCAALLTISRTVVIGLLVAIVVMAWRWPVRWLAGILAGATSVVIAGWMLHLHVVTAFATVFATASTDPSIKSRVGAGAYVFAHYRDYFWFGEGPGIYSTIRARPTLDNQYLGRLMETGVFGLTTFVILLCVALIIALRGSAATAGDTAALAGGLSGSIAVIISTGTSVDIEGFDQIWYLVWFVMALTAVVSYISRHGDVTPLMQRENSVQIAPDNQSVT
jgi:putative inorganic carbon (HCO3(-)) transporter